MTVRSRSHWAWGFVDAFPSEEGREALGTQIAFLLGGAPPARLPLPSLEAARVPVAKLDAPERLRDFTSNAREDRIAHTYGRGYRDLVRGFRGDFSSAPDLVAHPRNEEDIQILFDECARLDAVLVPYGGGTSVVGGVEYAGRPRPVVSMDLGHLRRVLEVDPVSRLARIEAGAKGPDLEAQLHARGFTLRCFPQSFEQSTLGGWLATRAGGHFATVYTHVDDLLASVRMLTPSGPFETRRLPASGAGPDPNRLVLGSEGTLGVITEAWMRVFPRPTFRASANVSFREFRAAVDAARAVAQSGLHPSNCRVLDPREALLNGVSTDGSSVLLLAFESADHELSTWIERALVLATRAGGACPEGPRVRRGGATGRGEGGEGESWREAFLRGPYLQSALVSMGMVVDTFETACTWDRFEALHAEVKNTLRAAFEAMGERGLVSCRFTHVYPDGPAPYYTFAVKAGSGDALERWSILKNAASEALLRMGATITHHHAVGRTHRPFYERERPAPFGDILRATKATLDPHGILNPGVLFD
ncbi:MAG TPA: FAD-binding oxidoreductase [Polyangiaceae bacterium]